MICHIIKGFRVKKAKKTDVLSKDLLALIKRSKKSINLNEIFTVFRANKALRKEIRTRLRALVESGQVFQSGKRYLSPSDLALRRGILEIHRGGTGFVLQTGEDIFVRAGDIGDGWHGDEVEVALFSRGRGRRPEGKVMRVLKRHYTQLPVRVEGLLGGGLIRLVPLDWRIKHGLAADPAGFLPHPSRGDILLVRPEEKIAQGLWQATILRHLGDELDVRVQEQMVKASQRVPLEFPQAVLEQAEKLPVRPQTSDLQGREDLRGEPFVTIDGETARDFDDAILVTKNKKGFVLNVAIADVAHYVRPGSVLDHEAFVRGNSWYFPCSVEPMLPQILSNGLCSLNPEKERLVLVARLFFHLDGNLQRTEFFEAVIKSAARLTYTQVEMAFTGGDNTKESARTRELLGDAWELAEILHEKRHARGCIDFDLPEMQVEVDPAGKVVSLFHAQRFFSHRLVEEFMVAANEAVASFLAEKKAPCLYRVHPEPDRDRLSNLFVLLRQSKSPVGHNLPVLPTSEALRKVLEEARGGSLEFLVNRLLLRSMMQAQYAPENSGHFGLASTCYCHFTSPIRRYADLIVHRSLKAVLRGKHLDMSLEHLLSVASEINATERRAMLAEREMDKRCAILFLRPKTGKTFSGVISSFSDFGFWVELDGIVAEGLVRLSTLRDDYYVFCPKQHIVVGERTGREFHLGQQVKVVLKGASLTLLEIELELKDSGGKTKEGKGKK